MMRMTFIGFLVLTVISTGNFLDFDNSFYYEESQEKPIIARVKKITDLLLRISPRYVWGGYSLEQPVTRGLDKGKIGLDCSGAEFYKWHKAGAPFVRTTSKKMWFGAWPGTNIEDKSAVWEMASFPDQIYFSFSKNKVVGHVGTVWYKLERFIVFTEASSSKRHYKETVMKIDDYRFKHMIGLKKLKLNFRAEK
jgi:hypothetical protein